MKTDTHSRRILGTAAAIGIVGAMILAGATSQAQPPPDYPPGPPGWGEAPDGPPGPPGLGEVGEDGEETEETRQRVQERLRIMRAWRLTEVLEMDEATAVQLFSRLDEYDLALGEQQGTLGELSTELRSYLEGGTGTNEQIDSLLDRIMTIHLAVEQLKVDLIRDTASFLDARQRATLMLFLPEFDREVRQMVQEYRRMRNGPRGRREDRGGDDDETHDLGREGRGDGRRGLRGNRRGGNRDRDEDDSQISPPQ